MKARDRYLKIVEWSEEDQCQQSSANGSDGEANWKNFDDFFYKGTSIQTSCG